MRRVRTLLKNPVDRFDDNKDPSAMNCFPLDLRKRRKKERELGREKRRWWDRWKQYREEKIDPRSREDAQEKEEGGHTYLRRPSDRACCEGAGPEGSAQELNYLGCRLPLLRVIHGPSWSLVGRWG